MFRRIKFGVSAGVAGCFLLLILVSGAPAQSNEFRAMWVDASGAGFLDASQVTKLIADCRTYNFNAVMVQMRRRGDAFYAPGIAGNDPKTTAIASSYDALADLLAKAHAGSPRIQVHCWVTTHVIWSSLTPPAQPGHVVNLHPEYLMRDSAGTNYLAEGFYLDPGHPDATLWNYVMATNIVRRYDVDGFHWDYVRYPQTDSGYNPTAIARYNAEYGLTGQPASSDPQFADWRRRQITDFLRWVNSDLLSYRSNLAISCAVFGSRSDAYANRFQDWAEWNNEGIIDLCMPMGYTADNSGVFMPRVDDAFNHQGVRRVYNGQGAYLNPKENTVTQLDYIRNKPLLGSVLYSYRVPNSGPLAQIATLTYIRDNHQPDWVDVPAIPWKTAPTKGIIRGTVTRQVGGTAVYNARLTITSVPERNQKTEPHGKFAFFETTPGLHTITVTAADLALVSTNVILAAGQNLALNLVLPPDNTPPVIASVAANSVSDAAATITWTTDENSNSAVDFGLSVAYGSVASNATLTVNHAITLSGLAPNTQYHFRVRSRNPSNLHTNSADLVFVTNPAGVVNDVIIESRDPSGAITPNPSYSDAGFANSTLKSSAPPLTGSGTQGSRYATSGTPTFTVQPTLAIAGATYDVYLTHGSAGSISDDIVVGVTQSGCTGLPAVTTLFREPNGNNWEYLGRMTLNGGVTVPSLAFTYSSGTLNALGNGRLYSDASKFVFLPPPVITTQPQDANVNQGSNATFSVFATGLPTLAYQWRYEGTNLAGATGGSYTVTNAQPTREGYYSVVITNAVGSVTSTVALLTVNLPPTIASPPQSQSVVRGADATFAVSAGGTEPLGFQWRFNEANIAGATGDNYTRTNVQTTDAGNYSVMITNLAGAVTSSAALLAVTLPPPPQFQTISRLPDQSVRFVLSGQLGVAYAIDASSNLTSWFELTTGILSNSPLELLDGSASNASRRFYRARQ
ncbi:MAG: family 10 glycosylhydrolase [Verrucomicrobiota bacterium]